MTTAEWVILIPVIASALVTVLKAQQARGHAAAAQAARTRAEAAAGRVVSLRAQAGPGEPPVPAADPVPADTENPGGVVS